MPRGRFVVLLNHADLPGEYSRPRTRRESCDRLRRQVYRAVVGRDAARGYENRVHSLLERAPGRTGHAAFVKFVLLAISLNVLRAASAHWSDDTSMAERSMAVDYAFTLSCGTVLRRPP